MQHNVGVLQVAFDKDYSPKPQVPVHTRTKSYKRMENPHVHMKHHKDETDPVPEANHAISYQLWHRPPGDTLGAGVHGDNSSVCGGTLNTQHQPHTHSSWIK